MKDKILFLLILIMPSYSAASRLDSLVQRLRLFGERIPQEKVYVHMDNTGYFLGDTIWFAAYTCQTNTMGSSTISNVLYAELWNHDGYLVERKLVEMTNGRGKGFFALTDSLMYGGFYELRAYTRWQLNWGEQEHRHKRNARWWFFNNTMAREYFRDYDKLYSRVFPVYDRPLAPGDFFHDMTLRPLQRQYAKETKDKLELHFFPEGGHLIDDLPCNVAFEASMTSGECRSGIIEVVSGGEVITTAKTQNRGRGVFQIVPKRGQSYRAVFTADKKEDEEVALTCRERLPRSEKEGVSLSVSRHDRSWDMKIQTGVDLAEHALGMTILHQGLLQYYQPLLSTNSHISVADSLLSVGVNQVTVFDDEGRVYADRLFFVTKPEKMQPSLSVNGIKDQYGPFEQITLELKKEVSSRGDLEGARLSLAVRDAVHSDITYDSGNIMTEMLLASEIKGFVPQPEWFFEQYDEEHLQALDLLMMVQGWRRFNWQDMAVSGRFEIVHPAEYTPILTGAVHQYRGHLKENPQLETVYYSHYIMMGMDPIDASESVADLFGKKSRTQGRHQYQGKDYHHIDRMDSIQALTKEMKEKMALDGEKLRREVRVHAEFVDYDNKHSVEGDVETIRGRFTIHVPRFYGHCLLFLGASDTTKWRRRFLFWKRKPHQWIMPDEDEYPEFYVRLSYPYPRFVKPYGYYHLNYPSMTDDDLWGDMPPGGGRLMNTVKIGRKRGRRVKFSFLKPIVVIDAYDAFNTVVDAGFIEGWYTGADNLGSSFGRYLVADMGGGSQYEVTSGESYKKNKTERNAFDLRNYGYLENLDRLEVYCDYSPRLEGDNRFMEAEKPTLRVIAFKLPPYQKRVTYRDRFINLPGYAYLEDFYHPDYHRNPPKEGQKDYRRTLYWNPDLQLDANGQARITFFNNSQKTSIKVEAEGMTNNGELLFNKVQ